MPTPAHPTRALIVAWERSCLTPVFGEAALPRLVRLAASENLAVTVWLTPQLTDALALRPRQAHAPVVWRVLHPDRLSEAVADLAAAADETLMVLPAHSVWDRTVFRAALSSPDPQGPCAAYRLTAAQIPAAVAAWQRQGPPESPGAGRLPFILHRPEEAGAAEACLVAALTAATQGSDGLLARWVDRPLSRLLSPRLSALGVAPNAVTLAGSTIGCLGALLLAQAGYWPHLWGALLFLAAVVLDGVDGEVARLTLRETRFGHYLDIITDNVVHVAVFCGIALGLNRTAPDARHLYALALLLVGFSLSALAAYLVLERRGRERQRGAPLMERLIASLNSRDFAYLVVLLAFLDRLAWFLWGAAVGTYVFAGSLFLLSRYQRQGPEKGAGDGPVSSGRPFQKETI